MQRGWALICSYNTHGAPAHLGLSVWCAILNLIPVEPARGVLPGIMASLATSQGCSGRSATLYTLHRWVQGTFRAMVLPRIMALMTSAAMLSNRSAPLAAQSPTLSPTRSAMTAGFLQALQAFAKARPFGDRASRSRTWHVRERC